MPARAVQRLDSVGRRRLCRPRRASADFKRAFRAARLPGGNRTWRKGSFCARAQPARRRLPETPGQPALGPDPPRAGRARRRPTRGAPRIHINTDRAGLAPLYDKEYAEAWIKHYEEGEDEFKRDHLEPHLARELARVPAGARFLDVGCGWGAALEFLNPAAEYWGADPVPEFFDYIRSKHGSRPGGLRLQEASLPGGGSLPDSHFDSVLCSMVLHTVSDMPGAVETIFSKAKSGAEVMLVVFNDGSMGYLRDRFERVDEERPGYIRGLFVLPSGTKVEVENYLHGEARYEEQISRHGRFEKGGVGPIFASYRCVKS